jgi:hypothetical protein
MHNGNQYAIVPVAGSCGAYNQTTTVPFNWSDIDAVEFGYMNGGVFRTGWPSDGTLNMTNIVIGPTIPAVPEPLSHPAGQRLDRPQHYQAASPQADNRSLISKAHVH